MKRWPGLIPLKGVNQARITSYNVCYTKLLREANHPLSVREFILKAPERNPIQTNLAIGKIATGEKQKDNKKVEDKTVVSIKNGWIVANGVVITGQRATAPWWNLKIRPREIERAKIAVTRYVPGRNNFV